MKVAFLTLGCKVNSYETDKMKKSFEDAGYIITAFDKTADVYIVNTCTVTNIADRNSRQMLHKARKLNPDALVVAAGCYVDSAIKKGETDKSIDIFITNKNKEHITNNPMCLFLLFNMTTRNLKSHMWLTYFCWTFYIIKESISLPNHL